MIPALPILALLVRTVAQVIVFDRGDQKVAITGIVQPQVHIQKSEGDQTRDDVLMRRLVLEADVTASKDWYGTIQMDFGLSLVSIRNAFVQYNGWRARGVTLTIGHAKFPFSRSYLTSGVKRETVERPFTGDRNYGTPNRALGVKLDGVAADRRVQWSAAAGVEQQIVNPRALIFDSPTVGAVAATTKGPILAGRADWYPSGDMPREQGDFRTDRWRATAGVGGFHWQNDGDRSTATVLDLHSVEAVEVSGGLRGHGVSADLEFHRTRAIAEDGLLDQGLYRNGIGRLRTASAEGGYMLRGNRVELVTAYDSLNADTYAAPWRRFSSGGVVYFRGQLIKLQVTSRENWNVNGNSTRLHELYAQMQFMF